MWLYTYLPPCIYCCRRYPPRHDNKALAGPAKHTLGSAHSARDDSSDGRGNDDAKSSVNLNRASFAETARIFTLVCSNDQERHAVTTTYRHCFRLELRAVLRERRRKSARFGNSNQHHGERNGGGGGGADYGSNKGFGSSPLSPHCGIHSSKEDQSSSSQPSDAFHANSEISCSDSPVAAAQTSRVNNSAASSTRPKWGEAKQHRGEGKEGGADPSREEEKGVTAEEFSEALVRCPEMLEAFGNQLTARFRHRHRPIWMAPFLRKGD